MAIKKDSVLEIKDAKETVQSYFSFKEENVTAFNGFKNMQLKALEIGK